jgi:hypothetical protein
MAAPFPLPAHQTGKICNDDVRMRHVWMPPFAQDVFERLGPRSTPKFPEHIGTAESARAAPLHVVPSNKEVSNAVIDAMVDGDTPATACHSQNTQTNRSEVDSIGRAR